MSNGVLTATDLRTLTLKDARAQTTATERALLRGPERDRFAAALDKLEAETRTHLTQIEVEYHNELERRNGRLTDEQRRTLKQDYDSKLIPLRRDYNGIMQRLEELTLPPESPIVQLRKAITAPVPVKPEPTPVEQDITGWLTRKEAAIAYGVSGSTMGAYAQHGKVEAVLIDTPTGKQYRIKPPNMPKETLQNVPVPEPPKVEPELPPVVKQENIDTTGWLLIADACMAYNLTYSQLSERLRDGRITGIKTRRKGKPPAWLVKPPATEQSQPVPLLTQYEQNFASAMMRADNLGNELVESLRKPVVAVPATTMRIALDFSPAVWVIILLLALIAVVLVIGQVQYYMP